MSRLRCLVLALLAASALALAACDGDTAENNDYVDQVNEVSSTLLSSVQAAAREPAARPQQVSSALEEVSTQVGTAATDLDEIEPPEDVADLHDKMVTDLNTLSDEATNAANEVAAGGAAAAAGVVGQFVVEANRIGAEIDSTIDRDQQRAAGLAAPQLLRRRAGSEAIRARARSAREPRAGRTPRSRMIWAPS